MSCGGNRHGVCTTVWLKLVLLFICVWLCVCSLYKLILVYSAKVNSLDNNRFSFHVGQDWSAKYLTYLAISSVWIVSGQVLWHIKRSWRWNGWLCIMYSCHRPCKLRNLVFKFHQELRSLDLNLCTQWTKAFLRFFLDEENSPNALVFLKKDSRHAISNYHILDNCYLFAFWIWY